MATKLVVFAAIVAALVAASSAQDVAGLSTQCQRELQERPLDACREVVDSLLAGGVPDFSRERPLSQWITEEPQTGCCQQLQLVSSSCRAAAIRGIVRKEEESHFSPADLEGQTGQGPPFNFRNPDDYAKQMHKFIRERLARVRQFAQQLPARCGLESSGGSWYSAGK